MVRWSIIENRRGRKVERVEETVAVFVSGQLLHIWETFGRGERLGRRPATTGCRPQQRAFLICWQAGWRQPPDGSKSRNGRRDEVESGAFPILNQSSSWLDRITDFFGIEWFTSTGAGDGGSRRVSLASGVKVVGRSDLDLAVVSGQLSVGSDSQEVEVSQWSKDLFAK
jgi:hypothetical protein